MGVMWALGSVPNALESGGSRQGFRWNFVGVFKGATLIVRTRAGLYTHGSGRAKLRYGWIYSKSHANLPGFGMRLPRTH